MTEEIAERYRHLFAPSPLLDLSLMGSSDAAAIAGLSNWGDAWDVWARCKKFREGLESGGLDDPEKLYQRFGKYFEPYIALEWVRENDDADAALWVKAPSFRSGDRFRVSPDYMKAVDPIELLEVKNQRFVWTDGVKDEYVVQAQFQAHFLDASIVHFAPLFAGNQLGRGFAVQRDRDFGAALVAMCSEFWERYVVADVPPPITGSEGCRRALNQRHGALSGVVRPTRNGEDVLVRELRDVRKSERHFADLRKAIENKLLDAIGEDTGIECDDGRITTTVVKGKRSTNWEKLFADVAQHVDKQILTELRATHTKQGAGYRMIKPTFFGMNGDHDDSSNDSE